jgi:hypothetical protein
VTRQLRRAAPVAILDDETLEMGIALAPHRLYRLAKVQGTPMRRDDGRDL